MATTKDENKVTKKKTKKTSRSSKTKKVEKQLSEKERQEIALQHIQQLIKTGQKKGSLTYTEIMNVMEEDELNADQMDRMYEVFAEKGIDILAEDDVNTGDDGDDDGNQADPGQIDQENFTDKWHGRAPLHIEILKEASAHTRRARTTSDRPTSIARWQRLEKRIFLSGTVDLWRIGR